MTNINETSDRADESQVRAEQLLASWDQDVFRMHRDGTVIREVMAGLLAQNARLTAELAEAREELDLLQHASPSTLYVVRGWVRPRHQRRHPCLGLRELRPRARQPRLVTSKRTTFSLWCVVRHVSLPLHRLRPLRPGYAPATAPAA